MLMIVGYGDVMLVMVVGKVFGVIIIILGIGMVVLFVGIIVSGLND